jgi:hypothetical protein
MYWKSRIDSMIGKIVCEKRSPRMSFVCPAMKVACPDAAILAAVTPPVYWGRLCSKSERLVARSPKTNIATNEATPKTASAVTTLWKVRVGRRTTPAMIASTTSDAMNPGEPVMAPVESVNQVFESWKKLPPAPIPMMRAVICRLRRTSGTSKAMISTEAMTSVQASSQPRNGCVMRLVKT